MYKKNTKRYMIIINTWSSRVFKEEVSEFDLIEEVDDYIKLINFVYDNYSEKDRFGEEKEWGYVLLDFKKEKILKWGKTGKIYSCDNKTNKLRLKDIFFRGDNEIPKDYKWDDGEYDGWLQFRWGNGKNAINYKPVTSLPSSTTGSNTSDDNDIIDKSIEIESDEYDYLEESFDKINTKEEIKKNFGRW